MDFFLHNLTFASDALWSYHPPFLLHIFNLTPIILGTHVSYGTFKKTQAADELNLFVSPVVSLASLDSGVRGFSYIFVRIGKLEKASV